MTSKEFITWLKGFLDASSDLTVEGVDFIQSKMKEVADPPEGCNCYPLTPQELYPPVLGIVDYSQVCPMGGQHDFPEVWYGIYPPPCKKCGYTLPSQTIYSCNVTGDSCPFPTTTNPGCGLTGEERGTTSANCCISDNYNLCSSATPQHTDVDVEWLYKPDCRLDNSKTYDEPQPCTCGSMEYCHKTMQFKEPQECPPYSGPNGYPENWDGMRYIEFEVPSECLISRTIDVGTDTYKLRVPYPVLKKITPLNTDEKWYGSNIDKIAKCIKESWHDKPEPFNWDGRITPNPEKLTDKEMNGETEVFKIPVKTIPDELIKYPIRGSYMLDLPENISKNDKNIVDSILAGNHPRVNTDELYFEFEVPIKPEFRSLFGDKNYCRFKIQATDFNKNITKPGCGFIGNTKDFSDPH